MERIWWLPISLIVVVGCQSQPPMNNPFQTTVPAPGTVGTAQAPMYGGTPSGTAPYIPGGTVTPTAPGATLNAPSYSAPTYTPTVVPAAPSVPSTPNSQYYPPGNSFDMRQSRLNRPNVGADLAGGPVPETAPVEQLEPTGAEYNPRRRRRSTSPAQELSAVRQSDELIAAIEPTAQKPAMRSNKTATVDRISFPQPDSIADASAGSTAGTELRIIDSPEVAESTAPSAERPSEAGRDVVMSTKTSNAGVELDEDVGGLHQVARQSDLRNMNIVRASFNQSTASSEDRPAQVAADFRHDSNYQSLQGKLEYSQSNRQWKLRYIPIYGDTDRFGGSVVLSDSDLLSGYHSGEFVSVSGSLSESIGATKGFAPHYEVEQIHRQRS